MTVSVQFQVQAKQITKAVKKVVETGIWDCVDDLQRAASGSAPHDKGILEQSWAKEVNWETKRRVVGTVAYAVKEGDKDWNGFNYALKMHEDDYNLGEGSQRKPGGVGMSGKRYPVGKKYLTNPLFGEANAYRDHLQRLVNQAVK